MPGLLRGDDARQIAFEGERLDVMSVRRWRDRMLGPSVAGRARPEQTHVDVEAPPARERGGPNASEPRA